MRSEVIAVTGAGGFVGRSLVAALQAAGRRVVPMMRGSDPHFDGALCQIDMTRAEHWEALAKTEFRPGVIIHLAGTIDIALEPDPRNPQGIPVPGRQRIGDLYASNVTATARLIEFAKQTGVQRIIFASSQAVYGFGERGFADETTPRRPLEHYAMSKACAEMMLEVAARDAQAVTVLRFPGVFSAQRTSGAVYQMCHAGLTGNRIEVRAPVPIPWNVIALPDLVAGISRALDFRGAHWEVFNLAIGEPDSLTLLARRIAALLPGCRVEESGVPQPDFRMSCERAQRLLRWRPEPLAIRLQEVIDSIRHDRSAR